MNRRRTHIYLIIIGVGLAAVVVDRVIGTDWLGQPDSADAATTSTAAASSAPGSEDVVAGLTAAPFPRGLPAAPSPQLQRDLFAIPPSAMEALGVVMPGSENGDGQGEAVLVKGPSRAEEFAANHQLSAILLDGDRYLVVVSGDVLEIGQEIDGCTLKSVDEGGAFFECGDGAARLEINTGFDLSEN